MLESISESIKRRLGWWQSIVRDNFHGQILLGFAITLVMAFVSAVGALQYLRHQHHDFISFSKDNTQSVILIELMRELIEGEAVELKSRIVQKNEREPFLSVEREAFFLEKLTLLNSLVEGQGALLHYVNLLVESRQELHRLAQRSMRLSASGFPESALFVWDESSDKLLESVRKNTHAFIDNQQQVAMQKLAVAEQNGQMATQVLTLLILLALVMSAVIGVRISHQLIKPIKQFIEAARGISGDDVDIHVRLPQNTQMEQLFTTLTGHIRDAVEKSKTVGANLERQRVARDLHDDVSQTLFAANLMAQNAKRLFTIDLEQCKTCIASVETLTKESLTTMRRLLQKTREQDIENTRLDLLLFQLCEMQSWRGAIAIQSQLDALPLLAAPIQMVFYRIAQEALNNVVKHAKAKNVHLILSRQDAQIHMKIMDDGVGFDLLRTGQDSLGVAIMRERASSLGCRLDIQSALGQGTSVCLEYDGYSSAASGG